MVQACRYRLRNEPHTAVGSFGFCTILAAIFLFDERNNSCIAAKSVDDLQKLVHQHSNVERLRLLYSVATCCRRERKGREENKRRDRKEEEDAKMGEKRRREETGKEKA